MSQLEGKLLDEADLTLIRAYALKINHGLTNDAYNQYFTPPHIVWPESGQSPVDSGQSSKSPVESGESPVKVW